MKDNTRKSLASSIIFGNLITLIITAIVVAFSINYTLHAYFMNDIADKDQTILLNMNQNVESFLNEAVDTLEYINLNKETILDGNVNQEIERINRVNNYFDNIEILDKRGFVQYTLPSNLKQVGHNRSGEDYITYLNENKNKIYWSNPFISPVSGKPTVTIAVYRKDSTVVGYLNLVYLNHYTNKSIEHNGNEFKVAILDRYGIYIANANVDLVNQRQIEPNFNKIQEIASNDSHIHIKKDSEFLLVTSKINGPNWYIVIYDDYAKSFESINRLLYIIGILILLSIMISAILSSLRGLRIANYINQFIHKTEEIASGDFDAGMPKQKYKEFNILAENFKIMSDKLKRRDKELERIAYTDSLTGLSSRTFLNEYAWQENFKSSYLIGVIYLDIDNFKNINDIFGHSVGDSLLISASRRIQNQITDDTILARVGGDEFVVIVPDDINKQCTNNTICKIMEAFKEPLFIDDRSFFVTVSMGISTCMNESLDFDTMLKSADIAMYHAKVNGKNSYEYFNPDMDTKLKRKLLIEQNLRSALTRNELSLVFQPQIITESGKVRGFETLLRWSNKELGQISPLEFIPIAEETGMIIKIGEWLMKKACQTIKTINDENSTSYTISINVSPVEINNPYFIKNLDRIIHDSGVKPEWIEIEITENVLLENIEDTIIVLNHLSSRGIRISLDDFGTGYSSLSYLNRLPISTLKIDREFIMDLMKNKNSQKMVDSIIVLAHKLGIYLIAEGVETEEQVMVLNQLLCDCIQGYYFSKPITFGELIIFLE